METLRIDILNPKAKELLKNLAELKLINIKSEKASDLQDLLNKTRNHGLEVPSEEEIQEVVDEVRSERYGQK